MRSILVAACCLLLAACTKPAGQESANAPAKTVAGPPASGSLTEILTDPEVNVRLAGTSSSSGSTNYSSKGSMLVGGEEHSSVSYEIGRLHGGDRLKRLLVSLSAGRQTGMDCLLQIGMAGSAAWQEYELNAGDGVVDIQLGEQSIDAPADTSLFVRLSCEPGNGVSLDGLLATFELQSGEAERIEIDLPASDIARHEVRVPMRALDSDGRIATGYFGQANLYMTKDEATLQLPLHFDKGQTDGYFNISETGEYEVQFSTELQNPVFSRLLIREAKLPVYEISIQQATPRSFDSVDIEAIDNNGTLAVDGGEPLIAVFRGQALERDDAAYRNISVQFPGGYADAEWGCTRGAMDLSHSVLDPSQLRLPLSSWLLSQADVPFLRVRPVHLRINGVYQGVYMDMEVADANWLDAQGLPSDSELYTMQGVGSFNPREGNSYFDQLFSRARQPGGGMQELADFADELGRIFTQNKEAERYAELQGLVRQEELLRLYLVMSMASANDNYRGDYAMLDPGDGSEGWSMLLVDTSLTFGITELNNPHDQGGDFQPINDMDMVGSVDENLAIRTVLSSPEGHYYLLEIMQAWLNGSLTEDVVLAQLNELDARLREEMLADGRLGLDEAGLDRQRELVADNVRAHWDYLRTQIRSESDGGDEHAGHAH